MSCAPARPNLPIPKVTRACACPARYCKFVGNDVFYMSAYRPEHEHQHPHRKGSREGLDARDMKKILLGNPNLHFRLLVAAPFKHTRKTKMRKYEFVYYYALDRKWMSTDQRPLRHLQEG